MSHDPKERRLAIDQTVEIDRAFDEFWKLMQKRDDIHPPMALQALLLSKASSLGLERAEAMSYVDQMSIAWFFGQYCVDKNITWDGLVPCPCGRLSESDYQKLESVANGE